jgi:predicted transport protein
MDVHPVLRGITEASQLQLPRPEPDEQPIESSQLENDSKERVDTATLTIEHVLPQNEELRPEWRGALGPDWKLVQETWRDRLGNLTLTGYNSEYSDLPFSDKKKLVDKQGRQVGFEFSPLRLNRFMAERQVWTAAEIEAHGKDLAGPAPSIWRPLSVDISAVREAQLQELTARSAHYSVDQLEFTPVTRELFDQLRARVKALGEDVLELPGPNTVVYRVYDFFLEVIPRKRRLLLVLNLDFDECDDPSRGAQDASQWAFLVHATESGGVLYRVEGADDLDPAMNVIRQAYEGVSE